MFPALLFCFYTPTAPLNNVPRRVLNLTGIARVHLAERRRRRRRSTQSQ